MLMAAVMIGVDPHKGSHTVLCDLVPGGHPKEISAAQAARILEQAAPSGAVARARAELAAEFLADLRRLDAQLRDTRKKAGRRGQGVRRHSHAGLRRRSRGRRHHHR
jgi:hypothetical protein